MNTYSKRNGYQALTDVIKYNALMKSESETNQWYFSDEAKADGTPYYEVSKCINYTGIVGMALQKISLFDVELSTEVCSGSQGRHMIRLLFQQAER